MKTYSIKPSDITRKWYLVDAQEAPLGRLSTKVASLLLGKQKTQFSNHIDCGDFVVVINADKLVVTGAKEQSKKYYKHSGFPGGLTEKSLLELKTQDSTKVIEKAVRGMLPVNKLRDDRLKRLKIFTGEEHAHLAQKPEKINLYPERGSK